MVTMMLNWAGYETVTNLFLPLRWRRGRLICERVISLMVYLMPVHSIAVILSLIPMRILSELPITHGPGVMLCSWC